MKTVNVRVCVTWEGREFQVVNPSTVRREVEVNDFGNPYRVSVPVDERYESVMGGERMEVVKEFKYLGSVLSKHGEMEGEVRERAVKARSVLGSLAVVMKGRSMSMEVQRGLRNSILLPTLMYGSEMWTWNRSQQSRVCAVEMSYLRGACGMMMWEARVMKACMKDVVWETLQME